MLTKLFLKAVVLFVSSIYIWSSSTLAEDINLFKNSEDSVLESGKQRSSHRCRLSGALLFANWDSIRANAHMGELLGKSIGEIIRKADGIFQRSEIKGSIKVELPNGEMHTIFERTNFDSFAFAEPYYFSIEFDAPQGVVDNVVITCDLEEDDNLHNDIVCQGSKSYKVRAVTSYLKNKKDRYQQIDSTSELDVNKTTEIDVKLLAEVLTLMGYDKLYTPNGAKDIKEVLERLFNFHFDDILDLITKLPSLLEDVSGIFLVGLSCEDVVMDVKRAGNYKKIDDSWRVADPTLGKDEVYGQLYLLPQATTVPLPDILESLGYSAGSISDKIRDVELPQVQGPAFPLFDLTRAQISVSDYSLQPGWENPISAYYKNSQEHSYVIFSNLWETDGNGAFDLDDCLAKGNAFGFDTVNLTKHQLSTCDYSQDISISLSLGEVQEDEDSSLVEYELLGNFDFSCEDDAGSHYEPKGFFTISIGNRLINQNYRIWYSSADKIEVRNGQHYNQPFKVRFRESESFMDTVTKTTLHGSVMEDDDTSGDDLIGNYNGFSYTPNELKEFKTYTFNGEDNSAVHISLVLRHVSEAGEQPNLIDYVLSGTFSFWCQDDAGSHYEPYGDFSIDIGNRLVNQDYKIWHSDPNQLEILNDVSFKLPFEKKFKEIENFMDLGQSISKITLHGKVMEDDDSSEDDLIGDYDGTSYEPYTLKDLTEDKFSGDDGNGVAISLQIMKAEDVPTLVVYEISGYFNFYCRDDAGSSYEPKGEFFISIGNMPSNQFIEIWKCDGCGLDVTNGQGHTENFAKLFSETKTFIDPGQSSSKITLHGKVMEDDDSSGDDLIGNYDGVTYKPYDLTKEDGETGNFKGEDGSFVIINLKIKRISSSKSGDNGNSRQEYTSTHFAHKEL